MKDFDYEKMFGYLHENEKLQLRKAALAIAVGMAMYEEAKTNDSDIHYDPNQYKFAETKIYKKLTPKNN